MLYVLPPLANCNQESRGLDTLSSLPPDFDPERFPIIAHHFFGWRSVGDIAAQIVQDIKFRRKAQRLHAKGPRLIVELLAELAASHSLGTVIDRSLDHYLALDDTALDITGGHTLPPLPIHEVHRGQS